MVDTVNVATVDDDEDWVQEVEVIIGGAQDIDRVIPLTSGTVVISYRDGEGDDHFWDGSQFVQQSSPIELSTTIEDGPNGSNTRSVFEFTVPEEAQDQTLLFEGWVNDDELTYDNVLLKVLPVGGKASGIGFKFE